jgi:hypothetical protein
VALYGNCDAPSVIEETLKAGKHDYVGDCVRTEVEALRPKVCLLLPAQLVGCSIARRVNRHRFYETEFHFSLCDFVHGNGVADPSA